MTVEELTERKPKCNKCGSHIVDPHCDGASRCPWVRCSLCGSVSDKLSDNYMQDRE